MKPVFDSVAGLADLDAEIEAAFAGDGFIGEPVVDVPARGGGRDDQAARLRALIAASAVSDSCDAECDGAVVEQRAEPTVAAAPMTIAVASGKGGVGKTNIAVNLAVVLAKAGHRVTLLDADLGTANADVLCGLTPSARLDHVLTGPLPVHDGARRTLRDIVIDAPGGFRLIPGSAGIARMADLAPNERRTLFAGLADLDDQTDVLIIDTAAGVGSQVTSFIDAADTCLVVSTPEPTSVADAYALIKCAATTSTGMAAWRTEAGRHVDRRRESLPRFQLVMNQCVDATEARRTAARVRAVCDRFLGLDLPMLGWVAQDVRLAEAVRARQPLMVRSPASAAAVNISMLGAALAQQLGLPERPHTVPRAKTSMASALRRLFRVD